MPLVTTMIWYRVGSRYEKPGLYGISHFIEHMMFKGTKVLKKGQIDFITTAAGGYNNAFTGHDYTAYYFSFASDRWIAALEIEADRMRNTVFQEDEFELERQVILEEIRMGRDNPWERLRQALDRASFPNHPYGNPVIGTREDVSSLGLRAVLDFYRDHYVPGNAVLTVVGDFDTAVMLRRVEDIFGCVPATRSLATPPMIALEKRRTGISLRLDQPTNVTRILLALPAPPADSSDYFVFQLIDKLLGQGKLSRLYQRLVEADRLVSLVDTEFEETSESYHYFLRLELKRNVSVDQVHDAVAQELTRMVSDYVLQTEFEKARNQFRTQFLSDLETTFDQSFQLGLYQTLGSWRMINKGAELAEKVTVDDVRQTCEKYLNVDWVNSCLLIREGWNDSV